MFNIKGDFIMKKILNTMCIVFVAVIIFSSTVLAHSGRTDSQGGHRDNKNVSGLGYYHYHHGYSAHLHVNGICPYETKSYDLYDDKQTRKTEISDIKAYINGSFIPSFNYEGSTYIIAEDLCDYGFDVEWDESKRSLNIRKNAQKPEPVLESENSAETYEIIDSDISTYVFDENSQEYFSVDSYNISGQTIIQISSMGSVVWDSRERIIKLDV